MWVYLREVLGIQLRRSQWSVSNYSPNPSEPGSSKNGDFAWSSELWTEALMYFCRPASGGEHSSLHVAMIPPCDPSILDQNPQFKRLYQNLTTNLLNPDGSTRSTRKDPRREAVVEVRPNAFEAPPKQTKLLHNHEMLNN